jgi:hypothetical protein
VDRTDSIFKKNIVPFYSRLMLTEYSSTYFRKILTINRSIALFIIKTSHEKEI